MPLSSHLAATALECLAASGLEFAVLHREADLAAGTLDSDVDIVVGVPPADVLSTARVRLTYAGLVPIVFWSYTSGGTATLFLSRRDATAGVQLDMTYDPRGEGTYRLLSPALLAGAERGARFPRLSADYEFAYLLRKRLVKRDRARVAELAAAARGRPRAGLERTVRLAMVPEAAEQVVATVWGGARRRPMRLHRGFRLRPRRIAERLRQPVGYWVEYTGPGASSAAASAAATFSTILPHSHHVRRRAGRFDPVGWARGIQPVRLRAGLVTTWAGEGGRSWPGPDLTLAGTAGIEELVSAMERRLLGRLA